MAANLATPGRWLRLIGTNEIYGYTEHLAKNAKVEEVTEQEAFPERFMTKKQQTRKFAVDLSTDPKVASKAKAPKAKTKVALAADASRGLDKKK